MEGVVPIITFLIFEKFRSLDAFSSKAAWNFVQLCKRSSRKYDTSKFSIHMKDATISRAEIQRAYRERKKQQNKEEYLEKERKRVKHYYVPSRELTKRERKKRNASKFTSNKNYREKRRQERQNNNNFRLKFNFSNKGKCPRNRVRNTVSRQRSLIRSLQDQVGKWRTKYRSTLRQIQRDKKRTPVPCPNTPRSKANGDMKEADVDPSRASKLRRNLIMSYALNEEIKQTLKSRSRNVRQTVETILGSRILRKYKLIKLISQEFGLNRNRLGKLKDKVMKEKKRQRSLKEQGMYRKRIIDFLERHDNSTIHPNKQEVKDYDGEMKPKRILTDYLDNLFEKFCLESPEIKVSRATFFGCRPAYILPVSFTTKRSCVCIKHQNMALMLKALKTGRPSDTRNIDNFFNNNTDDDIVAKVEALSENVISYNTWKRIDIGDGKKKVSLVANELSKEEFLEMFMGRSSVSSAFASSKGSVYRDTKTKRSSAA